MTAPANLELVRLGIPTSKRCPSMQMGAPPTNHCPAFLLSVAVAAAPSIAHQQFEKLIRFLLVMVRIRVPSDGLFRAHRVFEDQRCEAMRRCHGGTDPA